MDRKQVFAVNYEFLQCNFEIAIQKDKSNAIPRFQLITFDEINRVDGFDQSNCPWLLLRLSLILALLPDSARPGLAWQRRKYQTPTGTSLHCLGYFYFSLVISRYMSRPVLFKTPRKLAEVRSQIDVMSAAEPERQDDRS